MLQQRGQPKGILRSIKIWTMGALVWPLRAYLLRASTQGMEIAVEYWMALSGSSHVRQHIEQKYLARPTYILLSADNVA
jgi:hypothetical protein